MSTTNSEERKYKADRPLTQHEFSQMSRVLRTKMEQSEIEAIELSNRRLVRDIPRTYNDNRDELKSVDFSKFDRKIESKLITPELELMMLSYMKNETESIKDKFMRICFLIKVKIKNWFGMWS